MEEDASQSQSTSQGTITVSKSTSRERTTVKEDIVRENGVRENATDREKGHGHDCLWEYGC